MARKNHGLGRAQLSRMKRNMQRIQPPALSARRAGMSVLQKAASAARKKFSKPKSAAARRAARPAVGNLRTQERRRTERMRRTSAARQAAANVFAPGGVKPRFAGSRRRKR